MYWKIGEMNMDFEKGALFDPGFMQHIQVFSQNVDYAYYTLERYRNFTQKKNAYKMFLPKINALLNDTIGFYLGCLLWAIYIKEKGSMPILNNFCYGGDYSHDVTMEEIVYIENYFEKMKKDTKYYTGKDAEISPELVEILAQYKEFLAENEGFTKTQTTDDIKIPSSLKTPSKDDLELILNKIEEIVNTGKFSEFLPLYKKVS